MPPKDKGGKAKEKESERKDSSTAEKLEKRKILIWPEWSEAEVSAEKWPDTGAGKGKSGKVSATPGSQTQFVDPDGQVLLPPSLSCLVDVWRRPQEVFSDRIPVIVEDHEQKELDLFAPNTHLMDSELMRGIICQVSALWEARQSTHVTVPDFEQVFPTWCPWDHIHPHPKGVGYTPPMYNPGGKYCVRLHWMGCWRKITVDDQLPFDASGRMLLPATPTAHELWPAILTKALLKVISLDSPDINKVAMSLYDITREHFWFAVMCGNAFGGGRSPSSECGESSVVTLLSGWIPHPVDTQTSHKQVWKLLNDCLPLWQRDRPPQEPSNSSHIQQEPSPPAPTSRDAPAPKLSSNSRAKTSTFESTPVVSSQPLSTRNALLLANYAASDRAGYQARQKKIIQCHHLPMLFPHPVLLTMVRDEELVLPEKRPPEPELKHPYYLGLMHRARRECDPPVIPKPPPRESRYVQVSSLLGRRMEPAGSGGGRRSAKDSQLESVQEEEDEALDRQAEGCTDHHEDNNGDEDSKPLVEVEEGRRGDSGEEEAMDKIGEDGEERSTSEGREGEKEVDNTVWIHFDDFLELFSSLHVLYRPDGFEYRDAMEELSNTAPATSIQQGKGKGGGGLTSQSQLVPSPEDPLAPGIKNMLFVDSVTPVELVLSLSSISAWRDSSTGQLLLQPSSVPPPRKEDLGTVKRRESFVPDILPEQRRPSDEAAEEGGKCAGDPTTAHPPMAKGVLTLEKYSWRSVALGKQVLEVTTTATKGSTLKLPPGRHCIRLVASAPFGYHVDVLSEQAFLLMDENGVFARLKENSKRFKAHAEKVIKSLFSMVELFPDVEAISKECSASIANIHKSNDVQILHNQILRVAISMVLHQFSRTHKLPYKCVSAWRLFTAFCIRLLQQQLLGGGSVEVDQRIEEVVHSIRSPAVPESWYKREPTQVDLEAILRIQRAVKRYQIRVATRSFLEGTKEFQDFQNNLLAGREALEPLTEVFATEVFNLLFQLEPSLLEKFPFCTDEQSRAYYKEFQGTHSEIPPNGWGILCREVFHVKESQFVYLQFKVAVETCRLRVLNNDSGQELPTVLHWVAPTEYQPNTHGYTVVVDGWSGGEAVPAGPYLLRVVSSSPNLPQREQVNRAGQNGAPLEKLTSSFTANSIQQYYLPDRDLRIFRYTLKCQKSALISARLSVSKATALIRMEILDHNETVAIVEGKACCVIPAFLLRGEQDPLKEAVAVDHTQTPSKHKHHQYVLQASVMKESWPVAESAWGQVEVEPDKEESRPNTPGVSSDKPPSAKTKGGKGGKGGGKGKTASAQQQSQLDHSKPHWTLHVVTPASEGASAAGSGAVEMQRDTSREDELKRMTQAWETEQPGRLQKGMESRRKFLESKGVSKETIEKALHDSNVPVAPTGPLDIEHIDLTEYTIPTSNPRLLSAEELDERFRTQQATIREYRTKRQEILRRREGERKERNETKKRQLEWAQELQTHVHTVCSQLNAGRNAIREEALKAKRAAEEEANAQAAQESTGRESKAKGKATAKGKKK